MPTEKWWTWPGLGLVFILASFLVYLPALNLPLLADDYLFCHPSVLRQQLIAWGAAAGGSGVFFRPLLVFSYYIDVALWPQNSMGYHAFNLVLHGINAFLVVGFAFLWQQWFAAATKPFWTALLAGILFLVLPSHTETVAWVSGRTDLLSTCFGLLTLIFGGRYLSGGRHRYLTLSLATMSAALLSKENAIMLTPVLLILGVAGLKAGAVPPLWGRRLTVLAGMGTVLSAAYWVARFGVLHQWIGGYGPEAHLFITGKSLLNLGTQLFRMFIPALPPSWMPFVAMEWAVAVFWIVLTAAGLLISMRAKPKPAVWLWPAGLAVSMLCALLPTMNMPVRLFAVEGERLLYLPSVFACLLLIRLARPFTGHPWRTAIAVGVLALSLFGLHVNNSRWVQAGRLFKSLVAEASARATRPRLLILNLPASYGGAHMFISGLPIALRFQALADKNLEWFQRIDRLEEIQVFSLHDVYAPHESLRTRFTPTSADLTLLAPGTCFRRLPWPLTSKGIVVARQDFLAISFAFPNGLPEDAVVLYFNQGHLHALTP